MKSKKTRNILVGSLTLALFAATYLTIDLNSVPQADEVWPTVSQPL